MRKLSKQQNTQKHSHTEEVEIDVINPFQKSKNIQVIEDQERSMTILRVYGEIAEPEEYVDEISKLDALSKKYDVIEISLNSSGGSLNTAIDLSSVINNFQYVITIGKGEVASAAFMLWTMGNIKVVTDYSMYMAHRESYGMYGKTSEHQAAAKVFGDVYEELFEDCFGDILTEDEKRIAERSESWVSYKDLLTRPGVISYDAYVNPENPYSVMDTFISQDGKMFMFDIETQSYRSIKVKFGNDMITDMTDYLYGITEVVKLPKVKKATKNVKLSIDKPSKKKKKDNKDNK